MTNTPMGDVYRQEVVALRAELVRRDGPLPVPSLRFYANDIDDLIAAVQDRGVHPTETDVVLRVLREQRAESDALRQELREVETYRANAEAEELADLRADLARAMDRIADLQIKLHDECRRRQWTLAEEMAKLKGGAA